jgi:hypothetical protein
MEKWNVGVPRAKPCQNSTALVVVGEGLNPIAAVSLPLETLDQLDHSILQSKRQRVQGLEIRVRKVLGGMVRRVTGDAFAE